MVAGYTRGDNTALASWAITTTVTSASGSTTSVASSTDAPSWVRNIVSAEADFPEVEVEPKRQKVLGPVRNQVAHRPQQQRLRPTQVRIARFARSAT